MPSDPPKPRPSLGVRLALFLAVCAVALLAAEGVVRLTLRDAWDSERLSADTLSTLTRFSDDAVLYMELIPDAEVPFGKGIVVTDGQGRRVEPGEPWQPASSSGPPVRIALLGDSTSFSWRLPNDLGYPEQLRRLLARAWQRPVLLENWSVPGYNSEQEARLLETRVLRDPPDLLLLHYDHNDAVPALLGTQPIGMPPTYGDNALGSALVKLVRRGLRSRRARDEQVLGAELSTEELTALISSYVSEGRFYDRHLQALERMTASCRAAGVPLLALIFDAGLTRVDAADEHFERLHLPLRAHFDAIGLAYLDLYEPLQVLLSEQDWADMRPLQLSDRDRHPNKLGHRFVADRLAEHLQALPGGAAGVPQLP